MEALIYFALWAGLLFLLMRFGCGSHVMGRGQHGGRDRGATGSADEIRWVPPETDVDPVCGKTVRTDEAKSSVYDGTVYYFCSSDCRSRFEAVPSIYANSKRETLSQHKDHAHG